MFSLLRQLVDASQRSARALEGLSDRLEARAADQATVNKLTGRLDDMELEKARWEAEIEAELLKADSTYKSAQNAESRARTMKRSYEKIASDLNPGVIEDLQEGAREEFRGGDVEAQPAEGLQPLRLAMENSVPQAPRSPVNMKWGV